MGKRTDAPEWTFEPTVFIRGEPAEINNYKERFAYIKGALDKSRTDTATACFIVGLKAIEDDPSLAEKLDSGSLELTRAYMRAMQRKAKLQQLQAVMEVDFPDDLDGFIEWCQGKVEPSILDRFLQRYKMDIPTWRNMALSWLKGIVLADGQPHTTDSVKTKAVLAGIISEDTKDWNKLRQLASEEQLTTGERGYWQIAK